jgi:hypothetical protein
LRQTFQKDGVGLDQFLWTIARQAWRLRGASPQWH